MQSHLFPIAFCVVRLSFAVWGLLERLPAGTAAISVTRSSCAPAWGEESSSPGTGLLSKKNLQNYRAKILEIVKPFRQ